MCADAPFAIIPTMPTSPLEASVRALVEDFVRDITELVRTAAFEALEEALSGTEQVAFVRGNAKGTRLPIRELTPAPPRRLPAESTSIAESGAPVDVSTLAESIVTELTAEPGLRAEELKRRLAVEPAAVKQALAALLGAGRIQASGRARGTRYSVVSEPQPAAELEPESVAGTAS